MEKAEWSAGSIMAGLQSLHPDFYPSPVVQKKGPSGRILMSDSNEDYLTKDDLVKLNGTCGNILHRGTAKKLFTFPKSRVVDFDAIEAHGQKIFNLLGFHVMLLFDRNTIFACSLSSKPDGRVQAFIASGI
jgi:hypothetical protein